MDNKSSGEIPSPDKKQDQNLAGGAGEGGVAISNYKGFAKRLDNFFMITQRGSNFKTEFLAGIATFLAMAYILVVNPNMILGEANSRWGSVFLATVFGACLGTFLMAVFAKLPYGQAPGMGLNSVAGALIGGFGAGALQFNYNTTMLLMLISGIVFFLLSVIPCGRCRETGKLVPLREKVFDGVPKSIRTAIPVGIGLYIAFIGFQKATIVIGNPVTLTEFIDFTEWAHADLIKNAVVCLVGLVVLAVLMSFNVKGSIFLTIIASTVLAMFVGIVDWNVLKGSGGVSWKFWENLSKYFSMSDEGAFLAPFYDIEIGKDIWAFIMTMITFCMIDLFDTMGTVIGCAQRAHMVYEDGKPIGYSDIMHADSIATVCGAIFGTSTIATYVESDEGIAVGGKTGFTAIVVAGFFLVSLFFAPLFAFIPPAATAPALIYVGIHMIGSIRDIDFHDAKNAIPAFLAIVTMPFAYSITEGIGLAILSYLVIMVVCYVIDTIKYHARKKTGAVKPKWELSIVTIIIAICFCVFFFVPTHFA